MRFNLTAAMAGCAAAISILSVSAKPAVHHTMHNTMPSGMSNHSKMIDRSMGGQIVGNKRTHVFHMPGDRGNMPDMKNRVYFRTAAQAIAAGYHAAGSAASGGHTGTPKMSGSKMHGAAATPRRPAAKQGIVHRMLHH